MRDLRVEEMAEESRLGSEIHVHQATDRLKASCQLVTVLFFGDEAGKGPDRFQVPTRIAVAAKAGSPITQPIWLIERDFDRCLRSRHPPKARRSRQDAHHPLELTPRSLHLLAEIRRAAPLPVDAAPLGQMAPQRRLHAVVFR